MPTKTALTHSTGRRVLIVQNGVTDAPIARVHGDYGDWFTGILRKLGWDSFRIEAHTGTPLPDSLGPDIAGIILTGSPLSVADGAPWVLAMGRWALRQAHNGVPVLAVCFGHQAVGEVLGGCVKASPNGREYGTIQLDLTPEGRVHPLFAGIDDVRVQSIHADALVEPPPGATLLASTAHTQWQAFSIGSRLWAVQFHPELSPAALRDLCKLRSEAAVIHQDDHGERIIHNWTGTL